MTTPRNALCAQCHAPARFDTPEHHLHPAGDGETATLRAQEILELDPDDPEARRLLE